MENLIPLLPSLLGIDVATFYATLGVIVTVANLIGRFIPDSATGPLGVARKIAKVLGLYLGNRISPAVNTNDVARAIVATVPDSTILRDAGELKEAVATAQPIGEVAGNLVDRFQDRLAGREPSARYADELPDGSRVPDEYRTDGPFQLQRDKTTGRFLPKGE